ncbi:hypothetical protein ACFCZ1_36445 [Streptomyces sp. NPDC056224]|uniref:hypothetical protein n=1 Tax=Streptomyces sp. NPDC056224 TaxID=3345750 RepID=UPI0035D7ACDA
MDDGEAVQKARMPLSSAEEAREDFVACLRRASGVDPRINAVANLVEASTPPTAVSWLGFVFLIAEHDSRGPIIDRSYGRKYSAAFDDAAKFKKRPKAW